MVDDDFSWDAVEALLEQVETENGRPLILSRYGYHIKTINEKKYLVASTKEELIDQLVIFERTRSMITREEISRRMEGDANPGCSGVWPNCIPYNGCHSCKKGYKGNGFFYCECSN